MGPTGFEHGAGDDADPDDQEQGDEQRPAGGADRPELGPLRQRYAALGNPADGSGGGGDGAHASAAFGSESGASVWNSSESRVSSMNASSSEARCDVSS